MAELEKAEEEILIAAFVLTQNDIEATLIQKYQEGVNITGVIENRMYRTQGSIAEELDDTMNLQRDTNPKTMHHKVFVVDQKVVLTGSMNPTRSGDEYNDENLIIIENEGVAEMYREEILSLLS